MGDLDGVDGFAAARANRCLQVRDLGMYSPAEQVDPVAQVRAYAQATQQALADGYTGPRVAADVTSLVGTAPARAAFARYEHLIDVHDGPSALPRRRSSTTSGEPTPTW